MNGATCGWYERPGTRIAWQSTGAGPPIVLVHGFGLDHRMWDDIVPAVATDHTVVTYDCRGFGASPMDPRVGYTHAETCSACSHISISRQR